MSDRRTQPRTWPAATYRELAGWALVVLLLSAVTGPPLIAAEPEPSPPGAPSRVLVVRHEGMIHGVTTLIVRRALDVARERGMQLIVLELDTAGGLVDATEPIVQALLASPVPVVTFVQPRGAHAASAGFFILLAADVAAMAPATRTGAAHPVTAGGENSKDDIGLEKAAADLSALIRSTAKLRGRPADVAELAVRESRSWTSDEALALGLIDLEAADLADLLRQLDQRPIRRADRTEVRLALRDAIVERFDLSLAESVQNVVLHPAVMALLLSLAMLGIYVEFTNPGAILPGVVGATCLLIFLYGARMLPVNFFAAGLLGLGIVMFILEVKIVSHGLLAVGGTIAIALGLWLLFPRSIPGLAMPLSAIIPIVSLLVVILAALVRVMRRNLARPPASGREGLIGEVGVITEIRPEEFVVFVHGELWRARLGGIESARSPQIGDRVRVVRSEGLTLFVERALDAQGTQGA